MAIARFLLNEMPLKEMESVSIKSQTSIRVNLPLLLINDPNDITYDRIRKTNYSLEDIAFTLTHLVLKIALFIPTSHHEAEQQQLQAVPEPSTLDSLWL